MSLLLAAVLLFAQEKSPVIVLKGAHVVPMDGKDLDGGMIVLAGRKIQALGQDLEVPAGAQVIDLPRSTLILPGFIDIHTHLGSALDVEEGAEAATPRVRAVDAFTSHHPDVRSALASGVTAVALSPGNGNVVGGQVGVVKLNGGRFDRALFRESVALKISLSADALHADREPTSLAGALGLVRSVLRGPESAGPLPLWIHAATTGEMEGALDLLRTTGRPGVLLHVREAARFGPARLAGLTVGLGPLLPSDPRGVLETPALLAKAGAKLTFASDAPASDEAQLRVTASLAVKYGLDRQDALRGLTIGAAQALGLAGEIGSLAVGKDADLVAWSGDPLTLTSSVELVLVQGEVVYRKGGKP
jgi:imidazolonepropionase-like amidohydrolase